MKRAAIIIIVLMTAWASSAQTVTFASQEVAATVKEHIGLDDDAVVTLYSLRLRLSEGRRACSFC